MDQSTGGITQDQCQGILPHGLNASVPPEFDAEILTPKVTVLQGETF